MLRVMQDVRYTARVLRRTPAFTVIAVLSLAVGIGGTTAIFSLADALFFRPARGVPEPQRLVEVGRVFHNQRFGNLSYPNYADFRDRNRVFTELAAYRPVSEAFGFTAGDTVARVDGTSVSGNYFRMLGVRMALGRDFRPDEDDVVAPRAVTIISSRLWQRRFNSDPDVIGRTIRLNNRPFSVIGVAAEGFAGHNVAVTDLWIPMAARIIAFGSSGGRAASRLS